jgi:hypothetical protein
VQNVSGSAHSEQLAHELIQAGRRAGMDFVWENRGRETPERNAAVDALFQSGGGPQSGQSGR